MKRYYFSIPENVEGSDAVVFTADTESESFIITARFETDEISDLNGHWIFIVDRIVGESTEERSFVLNPNCVYFAADTVYSVITYFDGEYIGKDNLSDCMLIFSMPQEGAGSDSDDSSVTSSAAGGGSSGGGGISDEEVAEINKKINALTVNVDNLTGSVETLQNDVLSLQNDMPEYLSYTEIDTIFDDTEANNG